ncbi:hypothetical protein U1Q18_011595 [Sarracenia purpurea var. burkii]
MRDVTYRFDGVCCLEEDSEDLSCKFKPIKKRVNTSPPTNYMFNTDKRATNAEISNINQEALVKSKFGPFEDVANISQVDESLLELPNTNINGHMEIAVENVREPDTNLDVEAPNTNLTTPITVGPGSKVNVEVPEHAQNQEGTSEKRINTLVQKDNQREGLGVGLGQLWLGCAFSTFNLSTIGLTLISSRLLYPNSYSPSLLVGLFWIFVQQLWLDLGFIFKCLAGLVSSVLDSKCLAEPCDLFSWFGSAMIWIGLSLLSYGWIVQLLYWVDLLDLSSLSWFAPLDWLSGLIWSFGTTGLVGLVQLVGSISSWLALKLVLN